MRKRITAAFLSLLLAFPIPAFADGEQAAKESNSRFAERANALSFADMLHLPVNHWSKPAVYTMAALGVIKGSDGNFYPTGTATRSETLAVLMRAAGLEETASLAQKNMQQNRENNPYKYSQTDVWADGYIRLAIDYGIITIDQYNSAMAVEYDHVPSSRLFEKSGAVTRSEAAEWFVRLLSLPLAERVNSITDYADFSEIPQDKQLYIETAVRAGIIKGYGEKLELGRTISRQELAQMLYNARETVCEKIGVTVTKDEIADTFTDTVSATDSEMVNKTELKLNSGMRLLCTRTYLLSGAAVNYDAFVATDTDILTMKEGQALSGVNVLSRGDEAEFYSDKSGTIFYILCTDKSAQQTEEVLDESYEDCAPQSGKLYVIDEKNNLLVLEKDGNFIEIPYLSSLKAYYRNEEIPISALTESYLDSDCIVFTVKKKSGTQMRAYRMQIINQ